MTANRKLWLHVGLPKTATTAFQSWMQHHSDALLEQGISYPSHFGAGNDKHNFLVGDLRQNQTLNRLQGILQGTAKADHILLSDEGLTNHLDDFHSDALEAFRDLTQGWDVHVMLVTRDADTWLRSYHKQCVLNPNNGASPLWGTGLTVSQVADHPRIRRLLAAEILMDDLRAAFGAKEVRRFDFDSNNWFAACLRAINFDSEGPIELPRTNQSLPDWAIEVLRLVNSSTTSQKIRNAWKVALQNHLKTDHTILTNLTDTVETGLDGNIYEFVLEAINTGSAEAHPEMSTFLGSLQNYSKPQ
ncbi:MAG: hypothetical protein ABJO36_10415 [Litorimonas sp.]